MEFIMEQRDLLDAHAHYSAKEGCHLPKDMDLSGKTHSLPTEVLVLFFSKMVCLICQAQNCCTYLFYLFK